MGYKEDLTVDFNKLDEAWLEQPVLCMHYGEKHAKAVGIANHLKNQLQLKRAEITLAVKEDPEKYNLSKATDSAVDSVVIMDKEYQVIKEKHLAACEEADVMEVAKWAFVERKESIDGLIKLFALGFFSVPNLPKEIKDTLTTRAREILEGEREDQINESDKRIRSRLVK